MTQILLSTLVAILSGLQASAKEGFHTQTDQLPPTVQKAWDSVFLLQWTGETSGRTGTAFLVASVPTTDAIDLYFLTSGHNVATNCEATQTCGQTTLVQDASFSIIPKEGPRFTVRDGLIFEAIGISVTSQNPDLALLHARISNKTPIPPAIRIADQCQLSRREPLYAIGYFDTSLRTADDRQPIPDAEVTKRRWSEGLFISYMNLDFEEPTMTMSSTTVDTLNGGSGGPLFNRAGEVLGVIQIQNSNHSIQNRYVGAEPPNGKLVAHSYATPCQYLKIFIENGIKIQRLKTKISTL